MSIRETRKKQLYGILKIINKNIDFSSDRSEIVYSSIINNCSTTQLNQIIIQLTNMYEEYKKE